jgi:hypothetical protein
LKLLKYESKFLAKLPGNLQNITSDNAHGLFVRESLTNIDPFHQTWWKDLLMLESAGDDLKEFQIDYAKWCVKNKTTLSGAAYNSALKLFVLKSLIGTSHVFFLF